MTEEFTAVLRSGQGENIADELLKWWPNDFNHYTSDLSKLILPELTKQVAALISAK